jgi:hypothetical protein
MPKALSGICGIQEEQTHDGTSGSQRTSTLISVLCKYLPELFRKLRHSKRISK